MAEGARNRAAVASTGFPLKPNSVPSPATELMVPAAATLRMRWFRLSAIYTLPSGSTATPDGKLSWAAVAAPPSPLYPTEPFPAMVVITPAAVIFRIRDIGFVVVVRGSVPIGSDTYKLLAASTAIPTGTIRAARAGPPSPVLPG